VFFQKKIDKRSGFVYNEIYKEEHNVKFEKEKMENYVEQGRKNR